MPDGADDEQNAKRDHRRGEYDERPKKEGIFLKISDESIHWLDLRMCIERIASIGIVIQNGRKVKRLRALLCAEQIARAND